MNEKDEELQLHFFIVCIVYGEKRAYLCLHYTNRQYETHSFTYIAIDCVIELNQLNKIYALFLFQHETTQVQIHKTCDTNTDIYIDILKLNCLLSYVWFAGIVIFTSKNIWAYKTGTKKATVYTKIENVKMLNKSKNRMQFPFAVRYTLTSNQVFSYF